MQAPVWVVRLVTWRWMPSVALVVGSLAFVGVAVLVVPDDLGSVASGTERLSRATRGRVASNVVSTVDDSPTPSGEDEEARPASERRLGAPRAPSNDIVQSIFHPVARTELPVEPVDPNPQPPPPPPPPPPPTATIYTLESPPPMPPNPGAVPVAPPSEPQGITAQ